jgi:hypothetical protein
MAAANAVRGHANANATRIHHPWTRRPGRIGFGTRSRSHTADRTRARTGWPAASCAVRTLAGDEGARRSVSSCACSVTAGNQQAASIYE